MRNGEDLAAEPGRSSPELAGRAQVGRRPDPSSLAPADRTGRPPAPAPLHQPVLRARPRVDGTAPDRPRRIAGGPGSRMPRPLRPGTLQAGRAEAAGVRVPQRRLDP